MFVSDEDKLSPGRFLIFSFSVIYHKLSNKRQNARGRECWELRFTHSARQLPVITETTKRARKTRARVCSNPISHYPGLLAAHTKNSLRSFHYFAFIKNYFAYREKKRMGRSRVKVNSRSIALLCFWCWVDVTVTVRDEWNVIFRWNSLSMDDLQNISTIILTSLANRPSRIFDFPQPITSHLDPEGIFAMLGLHVVIVNKLYFFLINKWEKMKTENARLILKLEIFPRES